ncbi:pectinesterase 2-like [Diospyros lotus]|uniref:pectinesterase 2-like n=1 Tax=Diospyros lotus TaxID=55363 RepID=UPI002254F3EE|nr:pectinesterase 2-like [Diospyros lotus]
MARKLLQLLLLALFLSCTAILITPALSDDGTADDDIHRWCHRTPFPEPCKYYITNSPAHSVPRNSTEFERLMVEISLAQAVDAWTEARKMKPSCRSEQEMAAVGDCLRLYDHIVLQLNQTLKPETECTQFDAQTWLSTALTDLETCRASAVEQGVLDFLSPLMSKNVSELISDALAVNYEGKPEPKRKYADGFPSWVSGHDRELLQTLASPKRANLVVAQDGSGHFRTIRQAVAAAARRSGGRRFVVYVKSGIYGENIEIGAEMSNIMLVGDGIRKTIITGSRSVGAGTTSFNSATVGIMGNGFIARDITFRNTAGPNKYQAVALRSGSDQSVFYRCGIMGYQDTLFVHSQRQFYKQCYIYGTIDIIFGNAAVVFQNCMIYVRRPMPGQVNVITAQGRSDPNQNTGISIHNSRVMAARDLKPVLPSFRTYLGRPWRQYSRTVYIKTFLDSLVHPAGWLEWENTNFAIGTVYYGEYGNFGPGSSARWRVKWPGYHRIANPREAARFTVGNFIAGRTWLPATGVPFTVGL